MPELWITIKMDNAAFDDDPDQELARVLREIVAHIDRYGYNPEGRLRDANGNTCGELRITR